MTGPIPNLQELKAGPFHVVDNPNLDSKINPLHLPNSILTPLEPFLSLEEPLNQFD